MREILDKWFLGLNAKYNHQAHFYIVTFLLWLSIIFFYYKLTGWMAVLYSRWEIQYLKLYKIDAIVNVYIKKSESVLEQNSLWIGDRLNFRFLGQYYVSHLTKGIKLPFINTRIIVRPINDLITFDIYYSRYSVACAYISFITINSEKICCFILMYVHFFSIVT